MKVKFLPQDVEYEVKPGQSVLNVAHDNGVHIQSVCKGIPSCAECRVKVVQGVNNILPPMPEELNLIGTAYFVDQRRLSCQMRCFGDVVVDLDEQVAKENVSTKQPQGKVKKETNDSSARMGNILEDSGEAPVEFEITEEERAEAAKLLAETEARKVKEEQRKNQQQQSKKKTKNNRSRNAKASSGSRPQGRAGSNQGSQDAKSSSPGDKPKKKNNRNRNRNKKKAASTEGGSNK